MGVASSSDSRAQAITQLKAEVDAKQNDARFFDRKQELQKLFEFFRRESSRILVIVGPKDCGKTALLKEAEYLWGQKSVLTVSSPIFLIDCRTVNFGEVQDAANAIVATFSSYLDRLEDLSKTTQINVPDAFLGLVKVGGSITLSSVIKALRNDVAQGSNVFKIMNSLNRYMGMHSAARPIFVLDEANCLKSWPEKELKQFMSFFVAVTKQNHQGYLVLSSSDDFFISWLLKLFQDGQWLPFGVGPFLPEDAREFYDLHSSVKRRQYADYDWQDIVDAAQEIPEVKKLNDEEWNQVFEVCGGSPQLLRACAEDAITSSLEIALEGLVEDAAGVVSRGMNEMDKWDGSRYRLIMEKIVKDGHIGYDQVVLTVYGGVEASAQREVLAMLSENVIHVRYARAGVEYADLKITGRHHRYQIMARSPAHLAAMRRALDGP